MDHSTSKVRNGSSRIVIGEYAMDKRKTSEEITEDVADEKEVVIWIKEHKFQLLLTGVSVSTILATALGLKNKDAITELWNTLKKRIEKGSLYSSKWFEKANLEELEAARKLVQQDYNNPKLDLDYRNNCWNLLKKFDDAISKIKWAGKEHGYPVHSTHGWYLPSDD